MNDNFKKVAVVGLIGFNLSYPVSCEIMDNCQPDKEDKLTHLEGRFDGGQLASVQLSATSSILGYYK